jgi:hypothetical protein
MKRRTVVLLLVWLALLTLACRAVGSTGVAVFAGSQPSKDIEMKRDLLALMLAYPDSVAGVERGGDGLVYVVTAAGEKLVYDDGREKSYEQQLAEADIQDAMAQPYPLDMIRTVPEGNDDPGRIRCYALMHALYGGDRGAVEKSLRSVGGCGPFNQKNGAALALEAAFGDISGMAGAQPGVSGYVYPISGTYNYRVIAGTNTLSSHAFGIAIDLCSKAGDYWRYATKAQAQQRIESYPEALVKTMESHGFIWGGKWAHFDYLHFEYRPELIIKARANAQDTGKKWYSGFPEDATTRALIDRIDTALN